MRWRSVSWSIGHCNKMQSGLHLEIYRSMFNTVCYVLGIFSIASALGKSRQSSCEFVSQFLSLNRPARYVENTPLFNQCNIVSHGHTDLTHHWVFTLHFHTLQIQGCVTCVLFGRQGLHSSRASLALPLNAGKIASYSVNVSTSPNIAVLWHFLTLVHKIKFYGFQTNALRCRLVPNTSTSRRSP